MNQRFTCDGCGFVVEAASDAWAPEHPKGWEALTIPSAGKRAGERLCELRKECAK